MPFGLYRYLGWRGCAEEVGRVIGTSALRAVFGDWAARRASLVVALNGDVARRFNKIAESIVIESNIALDVAELGMEASVQTRARIGHERTAVFAGRLIPWKGLRLAIDCLRYAPGWRLVVFGDGPEKERIAGLAQRLGVAGRVELRGNVPRDEVLDGLKAADAFLFPSFHDAASTAVAEASAIGCPVVCLDLGGPALQAGDNAHVVAVEPVESLAPRLAGVLMGLESRGVPDRHLAAERLGGLVRRWYLGEGVGVHIAASGK